MSHLYNPYPMDWQSSTQACNGLSSAQTQSDPQRTSHLNPGSSYRSNAASALDLSMQAQLNAYSAQSHINNQLHSRAELVIDYINRLRAARTMSHLYNSYPTDQQSSSQARGEHSSAETQSDPQKTSHLNLGSSNRLAPSALSPNTASLSALPLPAFMATQSLPAKEVELKRSADLHSSGARDGSLHLLLSYAMTPPSEAHRKAVAESSDRSLTWLPTNKNTNEDEESKYYTSAASSIFSGGGESRFPTIGERKPHEQSIPRLGDYKFPVRETASAQPEFSQPKYTSESASKILLHFGLEKEDMKQLASYPEDQITPQNLPYILRQIRQQKTKNSVSAVNALPYPKPKPATNGNDGDFRGHVRAVSNQDYRPHGILKTSKVIDYGHISQFSAGPGEEEGMASGAHSVGSSTLLMDSSGREVREMRNSSGPDFDSAFSFKLSSKSLPTCNPQKEFPPPSKQVPQMASVPFTISKTDTDSRILPGVPKSLSLKRPEPSQLKPSIPQLSDTPSPSVASGALGRELDDNLKDPRQPLKQVSKVPEPKQQQQLQVKQEKKWQPAAQSPTPEVDVPAPAQVYDYAATTPGMFPHNCSFCNEECLSLKTNEGERSNDERRKMVHTDTTKPRIFIVGDCLVRCGEKRAMETIGTNLGLGAQVQWFGFGGMVWKNFLPFFYQCLQGNAVPDALIIHCGGNDLGQVKGVILVAGMKQDLQDLHRQFPQMRIIFSAITQRNRWISCTPKKMNKARVYVNSVMASILSTVGGCIVHHPQITFRDLGLFLSDGVHFTTLGNDIFLNNITLCLKEVAQ